MSETVKHWLVEHCGPWATVGSGEDDSFDICDVCVWTDNSVEGRGEVDHQIYRLGPMSPTHSQHELYRSIQKGGNIPEHGLQLSAANDRKGDLFFYSFHNIEHFVAIIHRSTYIS